MLTIQILLAIGALTGLYIEGYSLSKGSTKLFLAATLLTVACGVTLSQI